MKILIVGNFRFRSNEANALRVRGIAQALSLAGHELAIMDNAPADEPSATLNDTIDVISVDEYRSGLMSFMPAGIRGIFMGDVSVRHARAKNLRPDCIVLYGPHLGYLLRFRRLCRDLRIPLVLDIVEWYQPQDLPGGRFGPYAIANEISMRHATKRAEGVIVLSRRLERHYSRREGSQVINIPPLFDAEPTIARKKSEADGRLHLCYAGTPARKEAFDVILAALRHANNRGVEFTLHLVGMTANDLASVPGASNLRDCGSESAQIQFYGRVPNSRARQIVAEADFTLLLRPLRRANQFGFPSKLAESMAVGTPVIANNFSDLDLHLTDKDNAIFLPDLDLETVVSALIRAAEMTPAQRRKMAERALTKARELFTPSAVSGVLSEFLRSLK